MSRYGLFGANGYIGSSLRDANRHVLVPHNSPYSIAGASLPPDWAGVIWVAGWPGNRNVDDVEANPNRSQLQNVWEPMEVAKRCHDAGKRLLMISSGCIYDKLNAQGKPHVEADPPNFFGTVYLRDQVQRNNLMQAQYPEATIFRIRVPFDGRHHPRNVIQKLASMPAVWDSPQSYTWLTDLDSAVRAWENRKIISGIWHITQPGISNNFDLVQKYLNPAVGRITGGDRPMKSMACPRSAAILDSSKIQSVIPMTPIEDAWKTAVAQYKK